MVSLSSAVPVMVRSALEWVEFWEGELNATEGRLVSSALWVTA